MNGSDGASVFMQGDVLHSDEEVPFVSHLEGNLWMGGCCDGLRLPYEIQHVVSLDPWHRFFFHDDVRSSLVVPMADGSVVPETGHVVDWVLGRLEDGPTLVHCLAGLNRAGLVCGQVLVAQGHTALEAVALMRERRSRIVLVNKAFERAVFAFENMLTDGRELWWQKM